MKTEDIKADKHKFFLVPRLIEPIHVIASALLSSDYASQQDASSGTHCCSANISFVASVDCNHSRYNHSLSFEDACLY